jgi:2-aminoethylphosphonate transport system ATP-binding protein
MSEAVATRVATVEAAAASVAPSASGIGFEGVTVAYKTAVALDDLTLSVEPGEIMALIGPSGCGKTTALRAVAGFIRPTGGRVRIGETDVTDLPPYARDIGMVVQNYALFPHMRVADNVAFGLRARNAATSLIDERVKACLAMVGMADFSGRYPRELSGGQQQRVAIARALAIRPRVLLLDEPLSALDPQIRRAMLDELARLHRDLPTLTVLYVTHDQTEALTLADRIAIMRSGKLMASGMSQMLYRAPPNRFAAEFLGRANLLPVRVEAVDGALARVSLGEASLLARAPFSESARNMLLCIRPHDISLRPVELQPSNTVSGVVTTVQWHGDLETIEVDLAGHVVRLVCTPMYEPPQPHSTVKLYFSADDASLIPDAAA